MQGKGVDRTAFFGRNYWRHHVGRSAVRQLFAAIGILATVGTAGADDVTWNAAVPLWKSLGANGKVVGAGPAPAWLSEKPVASLGSPERAAPEGLPRPLELPEVLTASGPALPPTLPAATAITPPSAKRFGKESFASSRLPSPTLPKPPGSR
jgi:hypothetical protein